MAGLGNWAAVAEHVGTKGQESCRQHYYDIYIDSPAFPEPVPAPSMAFIDKLQVGALGSPPVDGYSGVLLPLKLLQISQLQPSCSNLDVATSPAGWQGQAKGAHWGCPAGSRPSARGSASCFSGRGLCGPVRRGICHGSTS